MILRIVFQTNDSGCKEENLGPELQAQTTHCQGSAISATINHFSRMPTLIDSQSHVIEKGALRPARASAPVKSASPGIAPRRRSGFRLFKDVLDHGGPGYLQFAITNICNAKCDFCGFAVDRFDPKQRRSVTLSEARDVIDICVNNHIGYLLFVGGEPLAHRDLRQMVRYAAERGIHPMICTNGSLWTEHNIRELASDGL